MLKKTQIDQYSAQWSQILHRIQVSTGKSSIKLLNVYKYFAENQNLNIQNTHQSIINITDFSKQYVKSVVDKTIPLEDVIVFCGHLNIYLPHQPSKIFSLLLGNANLGTISLPYNKNNLFLCDSIYIEPQNDDTFQYNFFLKKHDQYKIQYEVTFTFNNEQQWKFNQYQCSNCQNRIPTIYCKTENLLFCDQCCNQHHQTKLMHTHTLELINKINTLQQCKNHNSKQQYYCLKCQKYLCDKCIQKGIHHSNHQHPVKLVTYFYDEYRQSIQILPQKHRQKIDNLLKNVSLKKSQINDNYQTIKKQIINVYQTSMKQLYDIVDHKTKILDSNEIQLKFISDKLQWIKAFIKFQEKSLKPMHFFHSALKYQNQVKKLKISDFDAIFMTKADTMVEAEILVGQRNEIQRVKRINSKTNQPINNQFHDEKIKFQNKSKIEINKNISNQIISSSEHNSQKKSIQYSYDDNVMKPGKGDLCLRLQNSNLKFFQIR